MNISIFGLGYVGCVTAACLAKAGHIVLGVDINEDKVSAINAGRSPIIEKGVGELFSEGNRLGRLRATTDSVKAVLDTEVSLVCVGTPSNGNGSLDLKGLETVSQQIGEALGRKSRYHCVIFRSTVLPGTVRNTLIPILGKTSKREVHADFDVCFNPEFLREGSAVSDFHSPPFTIIGQSTEKGGAVATHLYASVDAPIEPTTYEVAEMVKYACNSFHALKVSFANEIGILCKNLGMDSHRVMQLFALDKKLNISSAYLMPGFAFGGSCLPKDLRALLYKAKELDVNVPVLSSVLESNHVHIQRVINWILGTRRKRIGILGLSFKPGTDDLRESPVVTLVETLIGKGCQVRIYDSEVLLSRIFGANKTFIEQELPHVSSLMCSDIGEVLDEAELVVVCKLTKEFDEALIPYLGKKTILDLVRIRATASDMPRDYEGICW